MIKLSQGRRRIVGVAIVPLILAASVFAVTNANATTGAETPSAAAAASAITADASARDAKIAAAKQRGVLCSYFASQCAQVYHLRRGINKPLAVHCTFDWAPSKLIRKGESSKQVCSRGEGIDKIYVYAHTELWCWKRSGADYAWFKEFDARGWHGVGDGWRKSCTYQRD